VIGPEGYRIIVFDGEGELVATFGLYGLDAGSFTLPTRCLRPEGPETTHQAQKSTQ
jgi:hypothetical protein